MEDQIQSDSTIHGPTITPKLQVLRGDSSGKTYQLQFKTRVGRETDNDIIIVDPRISRYHFQISFEDGKWLLSDLGSVNGTRINGMLVSVSQILAHGDQITIGETVLVYRDPLVEKDQPFDPASTAHGRQSASSAAPQPAISKRRMAWITGGLLLILLLALAGLITWLRRIPAPNEAAPIPTATRQGFTILRTTPDPALNLTLKYEEDFSDSFGGWDDAFGKNYTKQYGNNKYHIEITTNDLVVWGLANRTAADFEVEVEATKEEGGNANTYGLIFRYLDHDNYYRFDLSADGFFLLSKFQAGEWNTLVDWSTSEAINQGLTTINVLKVSASGPDIAIFANGEELARVTDTAFEAGNFGFFASTFDNEHMWVSFDNLRLWAPPDQEIAQIPTPTPTAKPAAETLAVQAEEVAITTPEPTPASVSGVEAVTATPVETTVEEATDVFSGTVGAVSTPEATTPGTETVESLAIEPDPAPQQLPDFVSRDQPPARNEHVLSGKIYFPVYDPGRGAYDIFRANLDGTERELIQAEASQVALSLDGTLIAYRSWKPDQRGLITRALDTTDHWIFDRFFEAASPVFSADDQFFVFHSREGGETPAIYRTVGADHQVLRRDGIPIQGEMAAVTPAGRIVYRGCTGGVCGLIISNLDGSFPQQLTSHADDTAPSVSPDGQTIAFMSNRDGNWEIYTISTGGQNLQRITDDPANDGIPTWAPDGSSIAFATNRDGEWAIWNMLADGRQERQLFLLPGSIDGIAQVDTAHAFGWLEERIVWTK